MNCRLAGKRGRDTGTRVHADGVVAPPPRERAGVRIELTATSRSRTLRFDARIAPSNLEEPGVARFVISIVLIALLSGAVAASDPSSGRMTRQFKPRPDVRQIGIREDDFVGLVGALPAQPIHERLVEWVVCPAAPIIRLIEGWRHQMPIVEVER